MASCIFLSSSERDDTVWLLIGIRCDDPELASKVPSDSTDSSLCYNVASTN